jgi:quinoprotein glucose dehydrogenase
MFTTPSLEGTVILPGTWGGAEWSGGAFDPESGILYVNANEIPSIVKLVPRARPAANASARERGRAVFLAQGCSGCHGADRSGGEAPSLVDVKQRLTPDSLERVIRGGRGAMPAFSGLSPSELRALRSYLLDADDPAPAGLPDTGAPGASPPTTPVYGNGGYEKLVDQAGRPGIKPPWGTLTAIDLDDGGRVWQIPLGEYPGAPAALQPTGTPNFGGAIVTGGGLVFVGATMDEKFRAIDKYTGRVLWEHKLPAGGYATPATYSYGGKQYVVIAAGGGGKPGTPSGDTYVAFSLP